MGSAEGRQAASDLSHSSTNIHKNRIIFDDDTISWSLILWQCQSFCSIDIWGESRNPEWASSRLKSFLFVLIIIFKSLCYCIADPFADAIKGADDSVQDGLVHIRIQQRNGRKTLTTVQGLSADYDLKKIVRACKKVMKRPRTSLGIKRKRMQILRKRMQFTNR